MKSSYCKDNEIHYFEITQGNTKYDVIKILKQFGNKRIPRNDRPKNKINEVLVSRKNTEFLKPPST